MKIIHKLYFGQSSSNKLTFQLNYLIFIYDWPCLNAIVNYKM